jgi:predicted MFS family arabinose efflux permease
MSAPSDSPNSLAQPFPAATAGLRPSTVLLMAVSVGVIVANIYYIQPLLAQVAATFHLTVAKAGALAMISQAGTAVGMFLFVPLGDKFERRGLVTTLLLASCVSLLLVATAAQVWWMALACFLMGAAMANVHVIVPFAAHLAAPEQRGRVVGTVVAGILFGVLLARTFSGLVGEWLGWRAVYFIAAGAMLVLAFVVRWRLPASHPETKISWLELMRSTAGLVRRYPELRESALLGALFFAGFSAFWTTLIFLLESPSYGYGSAAAGLFGLVGAIGAAGAPTIGHLSGKYGPRTTIRLALWLAAASFLLLGATGKHLAGLILGVILMDIAVQTGHVANQTRIYSIDPNSRSRLNMVYMVCYFVGGGVGSFLGALAWHWAGWWGVCGFGAAAPALGLVVETWYERRRA